MLNLYWGPWWPRYVVDLAYFFKADPGLLTKNIIIANYNKSFFVNFCPLQEPQFTNYYAAPEVLYRWNVFIYLNIWASGYFIYEKPSGSPLFSLLFRIHHLKRSPKLMGCLENFFPT